MFEKKKIISISKGNTPSKKRTENSSFSRESAFQSISNAQEFLEMAMKILRPLR